MLIQMRIDMRHIRWALITGVLLLAICHMVAITLQFTTVSPNIDFWTRLFDLDQEFNIPTYYNWLILALSGALSAVLCLRRRNIWWLGLSFLFMYLALDEAMLVHEQLAEPLRRDLALTNASPFFHAWVIPAIAFTMLLGMYLVLAAKRSLARQAEVNKVLYYVFLLAIGAIVIEIVGTKTYSNIIFYRFFTVMVEEIYEIGFSSFILYNILLLYRPETKKHTKA
jgi:hypothetical protein